MNARAPWDNRPPLEPPPDDAIRLYIAWQTARERRVELEATLPQAGETAAGGIVMPVREGVRRLSFRRWHPYH